MLSYVTWQGYWTCIALSCAAYYLWIYLKYFKSSLLKFGAGKEESNTVSFQSLRYHQQSTEIFPPKTEEDAQPVVEQDAQTDDEYAAYSLMDEVNAYLQEAKRTKCVREELVFALHTIVKKYPSLAPTSWADAVNKFLVAECKQVCSVHLSEEEVRHVWNGG